MTIIDNHDNLDNFNTTTSGHVTHGHWQSSHSRSCILEHPSDKADSMLHHKVSGAALKMQSVPPVIDGPHGTRWCRGVILAERAAA